MQKAGGNISSVLNYIVYILQSEWPVPRVHVFIQDIDPVSGLFLSPSSSRSQQRCKLPAFDAGGTGDSLTGRD